MTISPGKYNPLKPDIELFDFKSKKRYGLKLEGSGAMQVGTVSQDDSVHIRSVGMRVGDFDEQRSWKAGRGIENLSDNAEGYWDGNMAWTLTDGHVHQTLLWKFAKGLQSADFYLPDNTHSVSWKALISGQCIDIPFVSSGVSATHSRLWIRKVGNPGTLAVTINFNVSGNPASIVTSSAIVSSDVSDVVSVFKKFDFGGTASLVAGTTYHVKVTSSANDNKTNHWEIGGYANGATGLFSTDGTNWTTTAFELYYRVAGTNAEVQYFPFFLDEAMYVVAKYDNFTASKLYLNGDRGKVTAVWAQGIQDSTKSFAIDFWIGAYIKIIKGTGAGQVRQIIDSDAISIAVDRNWDINPDTTSEYIIYATDYWHEITSTGLNVVRSQPCVVNQIVYFPQGSGNYVRRMIWTGTTHAFSDDGTNLASFMEKTSDNDGIRVWSVVNSPTTSAPTISYAMAQVWANPPTALSYATSKNLGDGTTQATNMIEKEGTVYISKTDSIWTANSSFGLTKLQSGMDKTPSSSNGLAMIAHQQFIYYSWLYSVIRIYGSSHDDVGQDWSGWGLPGGREGVFCSFDSYTSLLMGAVDAGVNGTSSVLGFDGVGWHELIRAYDSGIRIRMVKVQPCPETRNRQWTQMGTDLVYQEMPLKKGSPRLDSGVRYFHEAVIESSSIDMGTASGLPKFVKEITIFANNLKSGNEINVDYQIDDDVHTTSWTNASTAFQSPESSVFLNLSNIRKFAYRLRIISSDNTKPIDVVGVTPNGYARAPYKMMWTLRCRADNIISRGRLVKPDELMRWLLDNARYPGRIEMQSQYELAHKFFVIIHPPRMFPYKPSQNGQSEESVFTVVLEEA